MTKVEVHSFEKGINQDLHKSVVQKNMSLEIKNMRPVASDTGTTFALETVEGNKPAYLNTYSAGDTLTVGETYHVVYGTAYYGIGTYTTGLGFTVNATDGTTFTGDGVVINSDFNINGSFIGYCTIRNEIYIFIHGAFYDSIYKLIVDTDGLVSSVEEIYNDLDNVSGNLDFDPDHPIKAIGIYETTGIKKIYWVDGVNPVRYAIVSNNLTENGEPYVHTTNPYFATDKFEFLPNFETQPPELTDIVSGNINTGVIKYAYQLYVANGAETAFSPTTGFINVTTSGEFESNSGRYVSGPAETNSGKGFVLKIPNNNVGFTRARIVAIHWQHLNDLPTIRIAGEVEVSVDGGDFYFTDTGANIGEYTPEEFGIIAQNIFTAGDIVEKDGRLIAANITYDYFDIGDYDSRSYRFNSSNVARVYEADDSYYDIDNGGNVTGYDSSGVATGFTATDWAVPDDADCINKYNDLDNDTSTTYQYMWDSAGTYIGSTGKNIDLQVVTNYNKLIAIDTISSNEKTIYQGTTGTFIGSYYGYANPYVSENYKHLQSNETYRVGIQFLDEKGRLSYVQWVTDFRMPKHFDYGTSVSNFHFISDTGAAIMLYGMYLKVNVKTKPSSATSFRLMIVPRTSNDRSVRFTGVGLASYNSASGDNRPDTIVTNNVTAITGNHVRITSPEIVFNKNITLASNDKLVSIGYFTLNSSGSVASDDTLYVKATDITRNSSLTDANNETDISDMAIVDPQYDSTDAITINAVGYSNYNANVNVAARGGTCLVAAVSNTSWLAFGHELPLIQYMRNLFGAQYGGNTYEARGYNTYVPISTVFDTTGSFVDSIGGDITTTYFDYSSLMFDIDNYDASTHDSQHEVLYVPLESTINCDVRLSKSYSKYYNDLVTPTYVHMIQEVSGTHEDTAGHTFEQEQPLYVYNTVYSQYNDVIEHPVLPFDYQSTLQFDTRVAYSDKKVNGEESDSWTKFRANNYIDVETEHGAIKNLYVFKNRLMFFQDNGFGLLSMNDRALIQDNNPGMLALGSGGLLDRYDYVSRMVGNLDFRSIIDSNNSLYWFDPHEPAIYKFTGSEAPISKLLGIDTLVRNSFDITDPTPYIKVAYDNKYNEVLFKVKGLSDIIVFSEQTNTFSALYDFQPNHFFQTSDGSLYSITDYGFIFKHNSEDLSDRLTFYGSKVTPSIKFIVNPNYAVSKVFDNLGFYSEHWVEGTTSDYKQDWSTTFDKLRVYNDFQNSDWVTLTDHDTIRRRTDEWFAAIPRDAVNTTVSGNADIFDSANLDQTQSFKQRIRGKFCVIELTFDDPSSIQKFVLPYIKVYYRDSIR